MNIGSGLPVELLEGVFIGKSSTLEGVEPSGDQCPANRKDDRAPFPRKVMWTATFAGHVNARAGAHPEGMKFWPASTEKYAQDNAGHWAVFWEITNLQPLSPSDGLPIGDLFGFRSKKRCEKSYRPEGPVIVDNPCG